MGPGGALFPPFILGIEITGVVPDPELFLRLFGSKGGKGGMINPPGVDGWRSSARFCVGDVDGSTSIDPGGLLCPAVAVGGVERVFREVIG
jgi:hypothetical protein